MGESKIEALLTGRRRLWLAIVWVLLLSAVTVLPGVDSSIQQYRRLGELHARLASRNELPDRARKLSDRVAKKHQDIGDLEATLVPKAKMSTYKQDLTLMARKANCRLRSIRPGPVHRRPLDEVLGKTPAGARQQAGKPMWEVEEHVSMISVQGTFAQLTEFLSSLDNDSRLLGLDFLDLHLPPVGTEKLILDLSISTFDLLRNDRT